MSDTYDPNKLISNCFDKLHQNLSDIMSHVEGIDDPAASALVKVLEYQTLHAMRRLRVHLRIPY